MASGSVQSVLHLLLPAGISTSVSALLLLLYLLVAYLVVGAIYSLTLHPLASIPGPKTCAVSRFPYWLHLIGGTDCEWQRRLHNQYGPVVRFGPSDVCYITPRAWKEIYGLDFPKAPEHAFPSVNGVHSIMTAGHNDHARVRKLFLPAFSERGLRDQEPLFQKYNGMFVSKLDELAADGEPVEMTSLFNFVSFDTMADLCFGHSLGLLPKNEFSPWVASIFQSLKMVPAFAMVAYYPVLHALFKMFQPKFILEQRLVQWQYAVDQVNQRLEESPTRPDIWNLVLEAEGSKKELSLSEMHCNAEIFMLAGSETTATTLSGATYFLLKSPDKAKLLTEEIRGAFRTAQDITFDSVANLRYLNAFLKETQRIYPAVPASAALRMVPPGGHAVDGRWLPGGTRVMAAQWASFRSEANFRDEGMFVPERWMVSSDGDGSSSRYARDAREVHQPFGFGPRNCLGRAMAMHEMRLIFASLVYHFDLEFADDETRLRWPDQRTYVVWEKRPLMVRARRVSA